MNILNDPTISSLYDAYPLSIEQTSTSGRFQFNSEINIASISAVNDEIVAVWDGTTIGSGLREDTDKLTIGLKLLKFAGAWKGSDINEMLSLVYKTRSRF